MSAPPAVCASKRPKSGSRRSKISCARRSSDEDLQLVLSEIGVTSDWSAAYTLNAGPMDAVVKIQLTEERSKSAQEYVHILRMAFNKDDGSATSSSHLMPAAWFARR